MKISAIGQTPIFSSVTEVKRAESEKLPEHTIVHRKKRLLSPVALSGWIGAGSVATAVLAGVKKMPRLHKTASFAAVGAIASHIGIICARPYFSKRNPENQIQG